MTMAHIAPDLDAQQLRALLEPLGVTVTGVRDPSRVWAELDESTVLLSEKLGLNEPDKPQQDPSAS